MTNEPERWLDRIVGACVSLFLGALALYGAVWLLCQVWTAVAVIAVVVASAVVAIGWTWWRSRW